MTPPSRLTDTSANAPAAEPIPATIPMAELWRVFGRIGLLSFGGPAAQIALMHKELVEARAWLSEQSFLRALSFCMLLPGPEAMQLASYAGWRLAGVRGGLIAGLLFVGPGALVILAMAWIYTLWGAVALVQAAFLGIKSAVLVIVLQALNRMARKALIGPVAWSIALGSFVAIFALQMPFPLILGLSATVGALSFAPKTGTAPKPPPLPAIRETMSRIIFWTALWGAPILGLWLGGATFLLELALFFSALAVATFGGAYAVLAYMTQVVVVDYGWLDTAQMIDALGLAETTPGPLILVTQFVAFLAGHAEGGWQMALAAIVISLWVTFVPCFLWIFAGAPYVDWLTSRPRLAAALSGITAAVVGVILNLALWVALHTFYTSVTLVQFGPPGLPVRLPLPDAASLNSDAIALAAVTAIVVVGLRPPIPVLLSLSALGGVIFSVF